MQISQGPHHCKYFQLCNNDTHLQFYQSKVRILVLQYFDSICYNHDSSLFENNNCQKPNEVIDLVVTNEIGLLYYNIFSAFLKFSMF